MTQVVASAELVAVRRGTDTRCEVMRSSPPFAFRVTGSTVHMIATAAGPVGGDRLRLHVAVGSGAMLDVRSVAATVVLPGPRGQPSTYDLDLEVGAGATLRWAPQPLVVARGADHRVRVRAHLAADARLELEDTVVLGRSGEPSGSLTQRLDVVVDGVPRLRGDVGLGTGASAGSGPATTGRARVVAQLLAVGHTVAAEPVPLVDGVRGGVMELTGGGVLAVLLGSETTVVDRALAAVRVGVAASRIAALTPR